MDQRIKRNFKWRQIVCCLLATLYLFCAPSNEGHKLLLPFVETSQTETNFGAQTLGGDKSITESTNLIHDLSYLSSTETRELFVSNKSFGNFTDAIWIDGLGRETTFRGFNVSGNVKLVEHGFKPFQNTNDIEIAMNGLTKTTGSNIIRYTIAWEGVHPEVDKIDHSYLDEVISQIKKVTSKNIYVLLDYHQDLFSRHLFNQNSWHTGNGAPLWITKNGNYPKEYCGIVCASWSQNNLTNEAIRRAFRNFWNNAPINTPSGVRYMQTEYLWQIEKTVSYIKNQLSPEEFSYVIGLDPFNEPVDGGMEGLTPKRWDNEKLWPMYQKIRTILNQNGWANKWVFAEPLVFWNTNIGSAIAPATGGGHLNTPPGQGFVFNSHFYDAGRMGTDLTGIDNATYFKYLDEIRTEARFLKIPMFLSEFGMWLKGTGAKDTPRMINAVYQAMEISDKEQSTKTRFADFYNPVVSGTQWHWDYYYDHHAEYKNGNPNKLITTKDAWNDEDFSVVGNYGTSLNVDPFVITRAYVRKSQGRLLTSHYNAIGYDTWNKMFSWAAIKPGNNEAKQFGDKRFLIVIWRGRNSDAPSEFYLPPHFDPSKVIVMTEKKLYTSPIPNVPTNQPNEVVITADPKREIGSGNVLYLWDDLDLDENQSSSYHYALVVNKENTTYPTATLQELQSKLNQRILVEGKSPIYLIGKMTYGGYPNE
ncbi:glycosyl hydrolase family 5 [Leptospira levettii]|uniref:cellulase family glycosylhydrolase n=1 Tax=Leptospira levettii TaxID=2023178 RepID=UPI000C2A2E09|nr:cellulase family glycosylhydrolase [Leptospira levettii]PJZ36484.1 glycosyl hydrolase family 5 [Leptospira levettii]PJZ89880.1 glycosyl hydrolase family 5 [Leptospira levettii]